MPDNAFQGYALHPIYIKQPAITNLVCYKAGMGHITMTDDSESPSKGQERSRPCTYVEIPETHIYGARFYGKERDQPL